MVTTALPFLRILLFLILAACMFIYPQEVLSSASKGLTLWVNYILPALFPFFIVSELLLQLGLVNFLGVLLEPLMRPVFRLPGKASFVLAMTHTSGIPIGAILTCKLRKNGDITRIEGERLLAFTSNPSPGFMFGAVASGMLGNPALGIIIAGSVYLANLLVGLIFRNYGVSSEKAIPRTYSSWRKALRELKNLQQNNKTIGALLADAVRESTSTIILVGGYIIFFSVITHLLTVTHLSSVLADTFHFLSAESISVLEANAIIQGFLETTLGCNAAVQAFSSLNSKIGVLALLLGWGGISVFAQVSSFTASTDLRLLPFVAGRTIHSILALLISQLLLKFSHIPTSGLPVQLTGGDASWLLSLRWSSLYFCLCSLALFFIVFMIGIWKKVHRH
ncbi:sporulation integral membrane protein YlbJ [Dehalobacter restrictus]|uniref:Sporulation integral membrane protein YlbJ n=1 Tax=Dehalobacter restrictus TaxID=55583 RepID=A0A857DGW2_9FIRM|nr:sporulation integral membrane protein YlbJ [Dehalobacter restrictus]QHA00147.1 sporulation integral membrane protein YlbJ [Dehalobacter restrictus]